MFYISRRALYVSRACSSPEVLVTHSKDLGQILKAIHAATSKIGGSIDIPTAINIAQLALKHRENKNLRQRIVVFVGSPLQGIGADEREMVKLAKKLKKNNVAIDFISFGDGIEEGETSVLKSFVDNATSGDNSRVFLPWSRKRVADAASGVDIWCLSPRGHTYFQISSCPLPFCRKTVEYHRRLWLVQQVHPVLLAQTTSSLVLIPVSIQNLRW